MNQQEIISQIEQILGDIATTKGLEAPKIYPDTELLGTALSIDSLDLASLIVELESITGHDPFHGGFINFRTAGELAQLYQH